MEEETDYFKNFKLTTISFNQYSFTNVLLAPSSIENFRNVILIKCGVRAFPIMHTNRYRQASFVDVNNLLGGGHNAIYSITGCDKSNVLRLAPSLLEYLQNHYQTLVEDRYFMQNNEITAFRKIPLEIGGSSTVTQGIQVEAQAILQHMFCRFDKEIFEQVPKYFFVYQVRITVLPPPSAAAVGFMSSGAFRP